MNPQQNAELPNIAVFPMKHPEMLIGTPEHSGLPEPIKDLVFARDTQTWD